MRPAAMNDSNARYRQRLRARIRGRTHQHQAALLTDRDAASRMRSHCAAAIVAHIVAMPSQA